MEIYYGVGRCGLIVWGDGCVEGRIDFIQNLSHQFPRLSVWQYDMTISVCTRASASHVSQYLYICT